MVSPIRRRDCLRCVGAAALATGLGRAHSRAFDHTDETSGAEPRSAGEDDWPMFQVNAANTGHHPTATGPGDGVSEQWCFGTGASVEKSPTVVDGTVYVGNHDNTVYALDAATGEAVWSRRFRGEQGIKCSPAVDDGTVYVGSREGTVHALDAATGEAVWNTPAETTFSVENSLTVAAGTVYVAARDRVYAVDAATGEVDWDQRVGLRVQTSPTVVDGTVYVGTGEDTLHALDAASGEPAWEEPFLADHWVNSSPAVVDGTVYVGSHDWNVYALDAASGEAVWDRPFETGGVISSSPAVARGTVYVWPGDATLYALDAATGERVWSRPFEEGGETVSPVVVDGTVYAGSWVGDVYAVDAASGDLAWDHSLPTEKAVTSQTVVDSTVYVGSWNGNVYALAAGSKAPAGSGAGTCGNASPEAVFDVEPAAPSVGQTVTFDAAGSSDPDGKVQRYEWDLDGDGTVDETGERVSHTYSSGGRYEVTLRVTDDSTASATATKTITVHQSATLALKDVRLVQTVEDSIVDDPGVSSSPDDPDMVAGRPTSVLFKFEGQGVDQLEDDATVTLSVETDTGVSKTADLRGKRIKELSYGPEEHPGSVAEEQVLANAPRAEQPPVFDLDAATSTVYVRLGLDDADVRGDQVELAAGSDFTLTESRTIRVGFMEVEAPRDSSNGRGSGDWAYGASEGRLFTRYELPGGDLRLEAGDAQEMFTLIVEECRRYMERVYPVESVTALKHPDRLQGVGRGWVGGGLSFHPDLKGCYDQLVDEFDDLDATVAIVPSEYHRYHGKEQTKGFHPNTGFPLQPQASASVEARTLTIEATDSKFMMLGDVAETAAHEIGHHLGGPNLYEMDPLAQRADRDTDGVAEGTLDRAHARTESMRNENRQVIDEYALRSTAFDLFEGTFSVLREGANRGYWGRGRNGSHHQDGREWKLGSFMSYSTDDTWADSYVYQRMLDDDFSPTPPVASLPNADDVPVLSGVASVSDDGTVETISAGTRPGRPMPDVPEGSVEMAVTGRDGNTIATRRSPDSLKLLGDEGQHTVEENTFTFTLPFPEETATVVVTHEEHGAETTVNPLGLTLRSAIRALPDEGFTGSPDDRRGSLLATVDELETELADEKYDAAAATSDELRADVKRWVRAEYGAAANQPTRDELLSLVDDVRARIASLGGGSSEGSFDVPDWVPVAGGAGLLGLGAGAYNYLRNRSQGSEREE